MSTLGKNDVRNTQMKGRVGTLWGVTTHVVPMVLAALVPHVIYALVIRHARAIVDRLERDGSVRGLGDVADDVEGRQHRVLVVGLARERAGVRVRRHGGERTAAEQ